jgi:formate dehydrogenase subunit gamma
MKKMVMRFTPSERWFHNSVMFSFVFLLVTGMAMIFFNLMGMRNESREFLSMSHKVMAVFFIVVPVTIFALGDRKVWRENIRLTTTWGRYDLEWLVKKPFNNIIKGVDLPPEEKFNPGQKVWMMIAIFGSLTLIVSGIVIWLTDSAIIFIFLHTLTTFLVGLTLSGHIFMALINRDTREGVGSIIDGEVDADWAKRHHPLWMERMAKDRVLEKMAGKDAGSADKKAEDA